MIEPVEIDSFGDFINHMEIAPLMGSTVLFRGQAKRRNLLPSIARTDNSVDTTAQELKMLEQLSLLGASKLASSDSDEWALLTKAQHFGLKTRCLDWTTNPLVALWFACHGSTEVDSYVYMFAADDSSLPDKKISPFEQPHYCIYQPSFSNERVTAQHGWFTLHNYDSSEGKFVPLEEIESSNILEYIIPKHKKADLLFSLDQCGINMSTLFPDLSGLCSYINEKLT
ncbi:TPA: FRG domain-containing protein [Vibrio vulnificus]|nr:FRG domain-containing protein [Vibrio vulnificus]HDY7498342.1 FRG domain-containing protein [Vibrio vulnificus]